MSNLCIKDSIAYDLKLSDECTCILAEVVKDLNDASIFK